MEKFVPYTKLGKKARQKLDRARRATWGTVNPVTRKTESRKAYNRKRVRRESDAYFPAGPFEHMRPPIQRTVL